MATKNCNICNNNSLSISFYSEDFATVVEIYCSYCNKVIAVNYIGATDWEVNPDNARKENELFIRKWEK